MNFWVGMCHWDHEPLARTKTSSAQFCYCLPDQTGLKLFLKQFLCLLLADEIPSFIFDKIAKS